LYTDSVQDGTKIRTDSTLKPVESGKMKLYRGTNVTCAKFFMHAEFDKAKITVKMELYPSTGYPSHWAFRPGQAENWVLELQWKGAGDTTILGTLELQQAESAPDQNSVVTFYWRSANATMCFKVGLHLNKLEGWDTGVVLKSRIAQ
jgi:hypothetical protein